MSQFKDMDGHPIKVGDFVGFKDDIEQTGRIRAFSGYGTCQLVVWDSVRGQYYEVQKNLSRVWFEYEGVMGND